jgi:hypothetical protein
MVSHELPSLFGICDDGVFLDCPWSTVDSARSVQPSNRPRLHASRSAAWGSGKIGVRMTLGKSVLVGGFVDVNHQTSWIPVYLDVDLGRISRADGSVGR